MNLKHYLTILRLFKVITNLELKLIRNKIAQNKHTISIAL